MNMPTIDRIAASPTAAARVIDAAARLVGTYSLSMDSPSIYDIIAHLHALSDDIHALARELAAFRAEAGA